MNRLQLGLLADSEQPQGDERTNILETDAAVQQFAPSSDLTFEHSVSLPAHFESRYEYPLLIWLHGGGTDQNQLVNILPAISQRNMIGASLRGTGITNRGFVWEQTTGAIELATNQVIELIDWMAQRFRINRARIFVAGAGCGGTMAFRLAFRLPRLFCGTGSFNGRVPARQQPLANLRSCRNVPVFWMHSRGSALLPESMLCRQLRLLHIAGFDVTLRQYPGGDELTRHPFCDFHRWMMEQIAAQPDSGIVL